MCVYLFFTRPATSSRPTETGATAACQEARVYATCVGTTRHQCRHRQTSNIGTVIGEANTNKIRVSRVVQPELNKYVTNFE